MSETLKLCPFCGGEAEIIDEHDEYVAKWGEEFDESEFGTASYWYKAVVCSVDKGGCGATGGWRKTEAEAITAWNTRAAEQSEQIVIEEPDTIRNEFADNGLLADDEAEQDSREKLEADVRRYANPSGGKSTLGAYWEKQMLEFLDRQATITERECFERSVFDLGAHKRIIEQDRTIVEYADKNAELQAKVDALTECNCPGYDPENHYCRYHAQDFELNRTTVIKLKRENAELRKLCGANDALAAENDVSETSVDANDGSVTQDSHEKIDNGMRYNVIRDGVYMPNMKGCELRGTDIVESVNEPDSREKLEADALELVDNLRMYGGKYAGDADAEIIGMLDRQAAITEREWIDTECAKCGAMENERDKDLKELQAKVDELTAERDYWKEQTLSCLIAAMKPGGCANGVMMYPLPDGYCEPSVLVADTIDSLRDFYGEKRRRNAELTAERDEWKARTAEEAANAEGHWRNANNIAEECAARARALDMQLNNIHNLEAERDELRRQVSELRELNDSLHARIESAMEVLS